MKKMNRFDIFIYALIIANIVAMVLESHQSIEKQFSRGFHYFELVSILIFSLEYLYRILTSFKEEKWKGVKKYMFSFFLIDRFNFYPSFLLKAICIVRRSIFQNSPTV